MADRSSNPPNTCLSCNIYCFLLVLNFDVVGIVQINEFVKRARSAKIHAYIISHLRNEMPAMMGKAKAQQRLIENLEDEFRKVSTFTSPLFLLIS